MFGNNKSNKDLYNIVNYILLPLKFLVKHAAFEDEQECKYFLLQIYLMKGLFQMLIVNQCT